MITKGKILVTGGGGYVGNVLCRHLLDQGYQVKCIDNFHKGQCDAIIPLAINPNFEFEYGDVTVLEQMKEEPLVQYQYMRTVVDLQVHRMSHLEVLILAVLLQLFIILK